ncbi:MAG: peptidoglycan bridge formation glycyltransferase FemA/FemB family protein, partial [Erysipelotrichaceae bacterium]|nr:peptidoglycan bridge formation glycyltransferase FemA/FemB family protein [Erysipelotrichaceae bacterium]
LASGLFLFSSSTSWDLYTYNRKSCNFLKPVDNLHYYAMQDMKLNKVKYYDMCGFSGSTDKSDPYYGLYSYKKSFNPEFTEYIGEFDFIINNLKYKTYLKIKKGFNRLYRKLNSIIYKRD